MIFKLTEVLPLKTLLQSIATELFDFISLCSSSEAELFLLYFLMLHRGHEFAEKNKVGSTRGIRARPVA
jgi:hypothetical protein